MMKAAISLYNGLIVLVRWACLVSSFLGVAVVCENQLSPCVSSAGNYLGLHWLGQALLPTDIGLSTAASSPMANDSVVRIQLIWVTAPEYTCLRVSI